VGKTIPLVEGPIRAKTDWELEPIAKLQDDTVLVEFVHHGIAPVPPVAVGEREPRVPGERAPELELGTAVHALVTVQRRVLEA
jgi:hypothetical protein